MAGPRRLLLHHDRKDRTCAPPSPAVCCCACFRFAAGARACRPRCRSPLEEMRRQFEVNVFGAVAMIKAVLPYLRRRRSGHIINITSMGGFITLPGIAYYCGSKFALEGISEALGKEVAPFGIAVTAVGAGSFRTDWAGRSMTRTTAGHRPTYDASFD
ncbi:SDR family NAD(P)-dependent oxidoreductase, partial [Xanthomonas sp. Kuri4-1]